LEDTSKASPKAARLGVTPMPPSRITASQVARVQGRRPLPARAPNNTALMTLRWRSAMPRRSSARHCCDSCRAASSSLASSKRPSPMASFSWVVSTRCRAVMSRVRDGSTKPRSMQRPASSSSLASTTSTRPGTGVSAKTGRRPSFAGVSRYSM